MACTDFGLMGLPLIPWETTRSIGFTGGVSKEATGSSEECLLKVFLSSHLYYFSCLRSCNDYLTVRGIMAILAFIGLEGIILSINPDLIRLSSIMYGPLGLVMMKPMSAFGVIGNGADATPNGILTTCVGVPI
ncbi:hypothetical protein AMTR_s00187p00028170 [Amborella trichopoda]|uniref:Uncharacterized protein n=1 Tax=Amborella trichopoda TaxID=13333 RepID=U5D164_AMBTC|nr:hypothetical protein AMTR_s00187p00028170 [Amborella trichopoda]